MNRKIPTLDPRRSVTPDAIELKFGTRDYVVGATQHAKNYSNRPSRATPPTGNGVNYHVQMFFLFIFLFVISCAALENTFLGVSPPFLRQTTCSDGNWFPRGLNFKIKHIPLLNLPKHEFLDPFLAGQFSAMLRLIRKLPLIVTGAL